MRKGDVAKFLIILALSAHAAVSFFNFEHKLASSPPFNRNYISDEVWYVSASRNILREVFHLYPEAPNATIQAKDNTSLSMFVVRHAYGKTGKNETVLCFETQPYHKIKNAIYCISNYSNIKYLLKHKDELNLSIVQPGWKYPDQQGILKYLNLEHPPIAKYFIAHQILEKDVPPNWRVPSEVLGALVIFVVPVSLFLYSRSLLLALASLALLFLDEPLRAMSMVAMLDVYAGSFSAFAFSALLFSPAAASIIYGIASSCKYTAFFYLLPIAYVYWRERGKSPLGSLLRPALAFLVILVLSSLPLIIGLGFQKWLDKLLWGIHWFLVSRPSGPPPASPMDWILGKAPSPLFIKPSLQVYTNSQIMMLALMALFVLFPLRKHKVFRAPWLASLFVASALLGFEAVYLAGNKTLYTFYTVVFTPFADVAAAGMAVLLADWDTAADAVDFWRSVAKHAWRWLTGKEKLVCSVKEA